MSKDYFVHESSYVDEGALIGHSTKVWHFCHVMSKAVIGNNCTIGQNVFIGNNVMIGNNVKIQNNTSIYDGVIIEEDVFIGPSVSFTNVLTPRSFINRKNEFLKTYIKKGVSLGANTTIVCGHTINEYAFVAAGAVVTSDVEAFALMMGVPARKKSWVCICGKELKNQNGNDIICTSCHKEYMLNGVKLSLK